MNFNYIKCFVSFAELMTLPNQGTRGDNNCGDNK